LPAALQAPEQQAALGALATVHAVAGAPGFSPVATQQVFAPGPARPHVALEADPAPVVQQAPIVPTVGLHVSPRSEQHRVLGLVPPGAEAEQVRLAQHVLSAGNPGPAQSAPPVRQGAHALVVLGIGPILEPPALQTVPGQQARGAGVPTQMPPDAVQVAVQTPAWHDVFVGHVCLQAPQLVLLVWRLTHDFLRHRVSPALGVH
jgi:hypothetical protein